MSPFGRILVPLDGSARAEAILPWIERFPASEIRLLHVCAEETGRQEATAYLSGAADRLHASAAAIDIQVVVGAPAEAIVTAASEASLIAMCTQGAGGGGRLVYGSVADRVARHAPVPALLFRGGSDPVSLGEVRRIVVPLDGSATSRRALPLAETIAQIVGAPIHLVTVIEPDAPAEATTAPGDRAPTVSTTAAVEIASLADHLQRHHLQTTTEIRSGDPAAELLQTIAAGDIIVATTHGRGTARRWKVGHVADRLLRRAAAPLLLIRADAD